MVGIKSIILCTLSIYLYISAVEGFIDAVLKRLEGGGLNRSSFRGRSIESHSLRMCSRDDAFQIVSAFFRLRRVVQGWEIQPRILDYNTGLPIALKCC